MEREPSQNREITELDKKRIEITDLKLQVHNIESSFLDLDDEKDKEKKKKMKEQIKKLNKKIEELSEEFRKEPEIIQLEKRRKKDSNSEKKED